MNATTVAVDLAKNVFEIALADVRWKILERARLTRAQFEPRDDHSSCRAVSLDLSSLGKSSRARLRAVELHSFIR